jgi:membrane associated rhomboid family serine protease
MRPITERLSQAIKVLVIANALVYAFYLFANNDWRAFLFEHLAISRRILAGELWQPLTALFVHSDFLNFFFNMLGLWFVGATIERQVGTRRFLTMFFLIGVVANLVIVGWSVMTHVWPPAGGCGSAVIALYVAFGTIYDRTPSRVMGGLVLEARVMTAILMGFVVLMDLASRVWAYLFAHLVAMLMGYLMAGGRGEGIKRLWGTARAKRVRRRYQVLEGGRRGSKPQDLN